MTIHQPKSAFGLVPVTLRPDMWKAGVKRYQMPEGLTLAEIAARADVPAEFWAGCGVIRVAGEEVPAAWWHRVRPKVPTDERQIAITLHMVPAGGKGLQILAQVALLAATIAVQFVPVVGPYLSAAVGIGGSILLQLLFPPEQPKEPKALRPPVSAGISGNPARPLEQLQRVLGRMLASPPHLIPPYTTLRNQNLYAEAVVGFVGNHEVTDILINGAPIELDETAQEHEVREGASGGTVLDAELYTVIEDRPNITLSNFDLDWRLNKHDWLIDQADPETSVPQWHALSGRGEAEELITRFVWPAGLVKPADDEDAIGVPLRFQFKRKQDDDWINGPELHFSDAMKLPRQFYQRLIFKFQAGAGDADDETPGWIGGTISRFLGPAMFRTAAGEAWEWKAHDYFDTGSGDHLAAHVLRDVDGATIFLDPATFPAGEYEVRWKRGLAYNQGFMNYSTYVYNGNTANFFDYITVSGNHKATQKQTNFSSECAIDAWQTKTFDYPLPTPAQIPLTLIYVKLKNGTLSSISATFHSRVNIYSGGNWNTLATSSNPAALYRHVLKDSLNAKPLDPSIIDDTSLQSWYTLCAAGGGLSGDPLECNTVAADSVEGVLKLIATAGWAWPRQNEKWGVITERNRSAESIVQNFTPLNSKNFQNSKPFDDIPHAIVAEFNDEDDDYNRRNRTIYGDGFDEGTATLFQALQYESITHRERIDERALLDWRQMRYRQIRRTLEVGAESLISQRGDLVGLTHDVVGTKFFYGLVAAVLTSGGNVTGLRLEATAPLSSAGGAVGVWIRYEDGTSVEKPINETIDTDVITFTTPFAIPASNILCEGCLVALGLAGTVYKRMLVFDIKPMPDFGAKLTLIPEASEIYTGPDSPTEYSLDFSKKKNSFYLAPVM